MPIYEKVNTNTVRIITTVPEIPAIPAKDVPMETTLENLENDLVSAQSALTQKQASKDFDMKQYTDALTKYDELIAGLQATVNKITNDIVETKKLGIKVADVIKL